MATTASDICRDALLELNVFNAVDAIAPDDMTFVLGKFNRLLDNWNAERQAVYNESFTDYTLTPTLSPHTIGPSGTFVVTQRPVSIEDAAINIGGSPAMFVPIAIRDDQWYAKQTIPGLSLSIPTDLYYSPDWPNGKLYFFGVPSVAYGVRLWTRVVLAQVVLTDTISLPPGYRDALTLSLAEALIGSYEKQPPPLLRTQARDARLRVFANNEQPPTYATADSGIPNSGGTQRPPGKTFLTRWM